jgi:K+-sensing histidine kinase KdpD
LGSVLVAVSDSGPGLPQASTERVFDPGCRSAARSFEAHGSRLWATPNELRGAVFYLMLPIKEQSIENRVIWGLVS